MHSFRLVPASEGPRREFKITLGASSRVWVCRADLSSRRGNPDSTQVDEGARGTRCAVSLRHGYPRRSLYADSGGDAPSPRLHSLDRNRLLPNPTLVRAGWRTIRLLAARRWAGVITATTAPPPFFMAASPIMTTAASTMAAWVGWVAP
jgi:hypothetical protein